MNILHITIRSGHIDSIGALYFADKMRPLANFPIELYAVHIFHLQNPFCVVVAVVCLMSNAAMMSVPALGIHIDEYKSLLHYLVSARDQAIFSLFDLCVSVCVYWNVRTNVSGIRLVNAWCFY